MGLALVLLSAAVITSAAGSAPSAREMRNRFDFATDLVVRDGVPIISGQLATTPDFIALIRRTVPEGEHVRVLVSPDGASTPVCGSRSGQLYWVVYYLLGRVAVCDRSARWWALYRTPDVELPPGSVVVGTFEPGLRLVDTRPAAP